MQRRFLDGRAFGPTLFALAVTALGALVFYSAATMPVSPMYARIGPTIIPYIVAGVLVLLGISLLIQALRGGWPCEALDPETPPLDYPPLLLVVAGLVANALLIKLVGFILSSTLMYVFVARAFGARPLWRPALIGFALAFLAFALFAELLGLRMGGGLIEDFL